MTLTTHGINVKMIQQTAQATTELRQCPIDRIVQLQPTLPLLLSENQKKVMLQFLCKY